VNHALARARQSATYLASVFPGANGDELDALAATAVWQTYQPQDLIVQQSAPFLGVYALCSGLVAVGRFSPTHKR
jgi:hypothetical protein